MRHIAHSRRAVAFTSSSGGNIKRKPLIIATCLVLLVASVCGVIMLGGAVYLLSIIVDAYNNLEQYTAQGGTCYASAIVPLALLGHARWSHKYGT